MAKDPYSVVDELASQGIDSSYASRASLYEKSGLGKASEYGGSAQQNTSLLNYYRNPANRGGTPAAPAVPPAVPGAATGEAANPLLAGLGATTGKKTGFDKTRADLAAILGQVPTAPSERGIREESRAYAQSLVDSIGAQYAPKIKQAEEMGAVREKRARALNVSAGLAGSDFGSSNAIKAIEETKADVGLIEEERDAKINAILADAEWRGSTEYQKRRAEYLAEVEGRYDKIAEFQKAQTDAAKSNALQLAASGVSLAALKSQAPEVYDQFLEETGYAPAIFDAVYNQGLPANQKREYSYQKIGGALYAVSVDPATNKPVTERITAPGEVFDDFMITPDGTPIFVNMADGTFKVAGASGQFSKGGGGGGGTDESTNRQKVDELFGLTKGGDGYVAPETFVEARRAWVADNKDGTVDQFNKIFRDYANPDHISDYGLQPLN